MGYMLHEAVIVTCWDKRASEAIEAFRETLPYDWMEDHRQLLVRVPSVVNEYDTWLLAPDGSKEGWGTSDAGDEYRARLIALLEDGEFYADWFYVRFGGDDKITKILDSSDDEVCVADHFEPNPDQPHEFMKIGAACEV